tara:strand:+ start:68476 stop:68730 length:255 start_codon:yes stop_codon:yes gene_type:complete
MSKSELKRIIQMELFKAASVASETHGKNLLHYFSASEILHGMKALNLDGFPEFSEANEKDVPLMVASLESHEIRSIEKHLESLR